MHLPVLLAVDILHPDTLVPLGTAGGILLLSVAGARAYEAIKSRQDTQGQDLESVQKAVEKVAGDLTAAKDRSDRRHEDVIHRVSTIESRENVADQKMVNLESHLRAQDVKLEKIDGKIDKFDDKLDRALSRDDYPRRRGGHGDAA